ncbi:MAG TPA: glycosyltransferase family 4 protein [Candidatus Acidoferrum sp.]
MTIRPTVSLRIAQVSPLYESVPPKLYGGTERVVSYITEELVELGHDVTLFASGDSVTSAHLVPCTPKALRLDAGCVDQIAHHFVMLDKVFECVQRDDFDVVHFHIDYFHFPLSRVHGVPHLTTLHGRLDLPDLPPLYRRYSDMPVVSISKAQRKPLPFANWIGNVYHGLPENGLKLGTGGGKYLAFLGRVSPEKRVDRAIEIAVKSGMKLKIAAKIDRVDREYFETQIKHLLNQPGIEYIGEIREDQKTEFLGNAAAYIFPIDWPEPFGLTVIEAAACGTPTLAFRCGSVPEIVFHGASGLIVDTVDEGVAQMDRLVTMDRAAVRRVFETRFTGSRMAQDYVNLYESIVNAHPAASQVPAAGATALDTYLTL